MKTKDRTISNRWRPDFLYFALPIAFLLAAGSLWAGSESSSDGKDYSKEAPAPPIEQSWCQPLPDWEFNIALPGWLAGTSGESGVKGVTAHSDIKFHELFDHLTHFPIALAGGVRYQRWEFFADGEYIQLSDHATLPGLLFTDANVHLKYAFAEWFLGYRLINCDKAFLSFFAGARWNYYQGSLSIFDNGDARLIRLRQLLGISRRLDFSDSVGWVDPLIGMRGKVKIWKAFSLYAEADGGGFNLNSDTAFELRRQGRSVVQVPVDSTDWSYQVQGGLEIQVTRKIWSQLGWRYLNYNYRKDGFTDKTRLNGPFLQTGMSF